MDLVEWTSAFIDNLNSYKRDLEKKEINGNIIECMYNGKGSVKYIVEPELKEEVMDKLQGSVVLVCLNKKENLVFMAKNWDNFIKNSKLKVIFSNPKANQQWSLIPYVHNKICEPASLRLGLKSIFESVPEIS